MPPKKSHTTLEGLVQVLGRKKSREILAAYAADTEPMGDTLTIIANVGVHHLPAELLRGHVFKASVGNLDFSSISSVRAEYRRILKKLAGVLKNKKWKTVYLVPFGHSTLSMQIKLLVYRVTRIETVDIFYDGQGHYYDLSLDQRAIIVNSGGK